MPNEVILILPLVLPAVLLVALRINAALIFLSLALGLVLVEYVAGEANSLLTLFGLSSGSVSASTLQLILLFVPAAATFIMTIFSLRGRLRVVLNLVPAAAAGAFAVLLAVPLLPSGLSAELGNQVVWQELVRAQALIVGVGAVVSLGFLWAQHRNAKRDDKRKR